MIVFLDTNILGLIAKPEKSFNESSDESYQAQQWFYKLLSRGIRVVTSTLCDYELRRGLLSDSIRSQKIPLGLQELDTLAENGMLEFLPVSREDGILAADLWAKASTIGQTSRGNKDIDVDVIISDQCLILKNDNPGQRVIVATKNIKHLSRFCEAANWQDIKF